jgi:molybdate transport system substrate-binding protein
VRSRPLVIAALVAATAPAALGACGGDGGGGSRPDLLVSAASSLKTPFSDYGATFEGARARFSFAGSDQLAAQIRSGARPDVFAAANAKLPRALFAEGLVEQPVAFARNQLVIAAPASGSGIRHLDDLARPGLRLAIGAPAVPVGDYTRTVLARLPAARRRAILDRVRSSEPDVAGIVGKLLAGAVDAGIVYVTDVVAARGRLRAVELPPRLRPAVVYEAAVVRGARHPSHARAFVAGMNEAAGRSALRRAGFVPPR